MTSIRSPPGVRDARGPHRRTECRNTASYRTGILEPDVHVGRDRRFRDDLRARRAVISANVDRLGLNPDHSPSRPSQRRQNEYGISAINIQNGLQARGGELLAAAGFSISRSTYLSIASATPSCATSATTASRDRAVRQEPSPSRCAKPAARASARRSKSRRSRPFLHRRQAAPQRIEAHRLCRRSDRESRRTPASCALRSLGAEQPDELLRVRCASGASATITALVDAAVRKGFTQ